MGDRVGCPRCTNPLTERDRFCESCGQDLRWAVVSRSSCRVCAGTAISPDGYCDRCGHRQPRGRDHLELAGAAAAAVTDRGLRHARNEDAVALATVAGADGAPVTVAVVCDGVSSTPGSGDAAQAAADAGVAALTEQIRAGADPERATRAAAAAAAKVVTELGAGNGEPPSCTYVSAVVTQASVMAGWLGDCRVYWLAPGGGSRQLTEDDSWAAETVAAGALSQAEAYGDARAHAITRWLGADAVATDPRMVTFQPGGPGVVLVCSDGLWNYLPDADALTAAVPRAGEAPLAAARTLVRAALDAGGKDNVSVAVIPFPPGGPTLTSREHSR